MPNLDRSRKRQYCQFCSECWNLDRIYRIIPGNIERLVASYALIFFGIVPPHGVKFLATWASGMLFFAKAKYSLKIWLFGSQFNLSAWEKGLHLHCTTRYQTRVYCLHRYTCTKYDHEFLQQLVRYIHIQEHLMYRYHPHHMRNPLTITLGITLQKQPITNHIHPACCKHQDPSNFPYCFTTIVPTAMWTVCVTFSNVGIITSTSYITQCK